MASRMLCNVRQVRCRPLKQVLSCAFVRRWVVLVTLLFPLHAMALQEAEGDLPKQVRRLSLKDILALGLEASPKLWEQRSGIDQAEAELGQAKAGRLPRMDYLQILGIVPEAKGTGNSRVTFQATRFIRRWRATKCFSCFRKAA